LLVTRHRLAELTLDPAFHCGQTVQHRW
jgi:hypothetical protein